MRAWLSVFLFLCAPALAAPDYEREKRWAAEVEPNIVVGDPVRLALKNGHRFLAILAEAANARAGVVVVHGSGIYPDWGLIGTLRQRLPDHGYTTLSIQMPVLAADAPPDAYAPTLPEAVERLQLAVAVLQRKGIARIAIVSHSMGSRMAHAYLAGHPAGIAGWASLGLPPPFGLSDAATTYTAIRVPVLDLYGSSDLAPVLAGATGRHASLSGNPASRQVMIAGANHFFADRENEMVGAVRAFLDALP